MLQIYQLGAGKHLQTQTRKHTAGRVRQRAQMADALNQLLWSASQLSKFSKRKRKKTKMHSPGRIMKRAPATEVIHPFLSSSRGDFAAADASARLKRN
jgi:hypothetical protein